MSEHSQFYMTMTVFPRKLTEERNNIYMFIYIYILTDIDTLQGADLLVILGVYTLRWKRNLALGKFKGIIFNWRELRLCLWSCKTLGFLCLLQCFPWRPCRKMNKAEVQRSVALEREAALTTLLSIGSPELLQKVRCAVALPTQRTSFEGSRGFGVTLHAAAGRLQPRGVVLPQDSCLFPLKQDIERWWVPEGSGVRTLGLYGRQHSRTWVLQAFSSLLCHPAGNRARRRLRKQSAA